MGSMARIMQFINLIWITGILEQQHIQTARRVIKLQCEPKLDKESHKALLWDLYFFLLHTNDLPKIINKISAPIIFVDDTNILFAHSNLEGFNKNIHIVFET